MIKKYWWLWLGVLFLLTKGAEMALAIKPGVSLSTTWQVQVIRDAVRRAWAKYGLTATITSSLDGTHKENSLHYLGLAEDYRTHDLPVTVSKRVLFNEVQGLLGNDYQVLFEFADTDNEHLHIEYDPKRTNR